MMSELKLAIACALMSKYSPDPTSDISPDEVRQQNFVAWCHQPISYHCVVLKTRTWSGQYREQRSQPVHCREGTFHIDILSTEASIPWTKVWVSTPSHNLLPPIHSSKISKLCMHSPLAQINFFNMYYSYSPVVPINECVLRLDNCDVNAVCTDTATSFECACQSGYSGDGVNCTGKIIFSFCLLQMILWAEQRHLQFHNFKD